MAKRVIDPCLAQDVNAEVLGCACEFDDSDVPESSCSLPSWLVLVSFVPLWSPASPCDDFEALSVLLPRSLCPILTWSQE